MLEYLIFLVIVVPAIAVSMLLTKAIYTTFGFALAAATGLLLAAVVCKLIEYVVDYIWPF